MYTHFTWKGKTLSYNGHVNRIVLWPAPENWCVKGCTLKVKVLQHQVKFLSDLLMLLNLCHYYCKLQQGGCDDIVTHLLHVGFHHLHTIFRALTNCDVYWNLAPWLRFHGPVYTKRNKQHIISSIESL
jgi:hypothetical protein